MMMWWQPHCFSIIIIILIVYNVISSCVILTRETREWSVKPMKPQTHTRETPTRKAWGRGLTGMGTGWPGIPQGYPWYSIALVQTGSKGHDRDRGEWGMGAHTYFLLLKFFFNNTCFKGLNDWCDAVVPFSNEFIYFNDQHTGTWKSLSFGNFFWVFFLFTG